MYNATCWMKQDLKKKYIYIFELSKYYKKSIFKENYLVSFIYFVPDDYISF